MLLILIMLVGHELLNVTTDTLIVTRTHYNKISVRRYAYIVWDR